MIHLKKYLLIMKSTWDEYAVYRLNFVMWRVRLVMQILVVYFLWRALFVTKDSLFGYTEAMMFSYVLLSSIIRTLVLGTTTMEIPDIINEGNLSNYLLRPLSFFRYYFARDTADKLLNVMFAAVEFTVIFLLLRPPFFFQTRPEYIFLTVAAVALGIVLYFLFSFSLGCLGFWLTDVWAVRFLSFVIMDFFAGGLFPLDILPAPLYAASKSMPFYFFIFFPLKTYMGQLSIQDIISGFVVGCVWIGFFYVTLRYLWSRGLRVYSAEGR